MRLIDAERLDKEGWMLRRVSRVDGDNPIIEQMFPSYFPTVEAAPVKTGKWETKFIPEEASFDNVPWLIMRCSNCGVKWHLATDNQTPPYNYCPNCGARMENDDE